MLTITHALIQLPCLSVPQQIFFLESVPEQIYFRVYDCAGWVSSSNFTRLTYCLIHILDCGLFVEEGTHVFLNFLLVWDGNAWYGNKEKLAASVDLCIWVNMDKRMESVGAIEPRILKKWHTRVNIDKQLNSSAVIVECNT